MTKTPSVFKTRVLLRLSKKNTIKRLVNIQAMYKNNTFFEYKITFDGFPKGICTFLKGGVIDSIKGIKKQGKAKNLKGFLEIGYHSDGNVFYKDVKGFGNFSKEKFPPVKKIKKPTMFLRIIGFCFNRLLFMDDKKLQSQDKPIPLKNFSTSSFITCDFFLSKDVSPRGIPYELRPPKKKNAYKNFQTLQFEDRDMNTALHLLFYASEGKGIHVLIPPRGFLKRMRNYYWYLRFRLLDKF